MRIQSPCPCGAHIWMGLTGNCLLNCITGWVGSWSAYPFTPAVYWPRAALLFHVILTPTANEQTDDLQPWTDDQEATGGLESCSLWPSGQAGLRGMGGTTTAPVMTTGHFPEGLGCHASRSGCLKTVTCALPWSPMGGKRTQRSWAGRWLRTARSHLFSQWHENRGHQPTEQTGDDVRGWRKAKVWNGHHKV